MDKCVRTCNWSMYLVPMEKQQMNKDEVDGEEKGTYIVNATSPISSIHWW